MNNKENAGVLAILDELETQGEVKNSAKEMGKDLAIGAVSAVIGVFVGKPSLLYGLGVAFAGHYYNQPRLTSVGLGLLTSGSFAIAQAVKKGLASNVNGLEGPNAKLKLLTDNLKEAFYLDKLIKSGTKGKQENVSGLGSVQYFKFPNTELDMGSLNAIEDEITRHGEQFEKREIAGAENDVSGAEEYVSGIEDEIAGMEDKIY